MNEGETAPQEGSPLVGSVIEFAWRVTQSAVAEFGEAVGEEHPIHSSDQAARAAGLAGAIVPGTFLVGLSGNAAARFFKSTGRSGLAYGYDRIRFTRPVSTSETLSVRYRIEHHDLATGTLRADVAIHDREGNVVMVATHLSKVF
jgi:3-hydroxybutyryl-CoA dehydratase